MYLTPAQIYRSELHGKVFKIFHIDRAREHVCCSIGTDNAIQFHFPSRYFPNPLVHATKESFTRRTFMRTPSIVQDDESEECI
jgi:hypothetical protein